MDELERAGRALRDSVAVEGDPSDRVRARARTIVRRRRMFAAGSIATAVIVASVGIALAVRGGDGLGVHTIAPAASSTTRSVRTATAQRDVANVQQMPLLAFADPLNGWRVDPLLYQAIEHTNDGGLTWTVQLHLPSVVNTVGGVVAVDDHDAFALITEGGDGNSAQLMRTTDGAHWYQTNGTGLRAPIAFVSFADANHGWGLTRYGDLVTTTDGGDHWRAMSQPDPGRVTSGAGIAGSVCLAGAQSGWAATGTAVYRSDDDGSSWDKQVKIPTGGGLTIKMACDGSHAAYASFDAGAGQHFGAFLRTGDGGAHWRVLTEDRVAGATPVTAPGFPDNQERGDPDALTRDGTLVFTTGCYACGPEQNWVVVASRTDRFVIGHFDSTNQQQVILLAVSAPDATHVFAEVQSIARTGDGPRPVSLYASSDGGHTWPLRWTGGERTG
jgi:photosystem II stability/assembly factor-like uncharacterized protein